jgi:hypothetical protein
MALVTVSNRDKKIIIWNFMEELWENYQNAIENKLNTQFKFMDFYNVGLLSQYLSQTGVEGLADKIVVDILKEYAKKSGYIKIKGNTVELTKKGLKECQKSKHQWDNVHSRK